MAKRLFVKGYQEFKDTIGKISTKGRINVYFVGSKDETGVCWCPDCVESEPHVEAAITKFSKKEDVLVVVDVGDRQFWKDPKNAFRMDKDLFLSVIPTLIRWNNQKRLEGKYQMTNDTLLEKFFTDK